MTTYRPEPAGLDKLSITAKTLVTAAVGDHVLIADLSDSSNLKKVTVQTIVDLASGGGGIPTAITVANEAVDTSCFVLFATAANGNIEPKTNSGLTYNSATGALSSNRGTTDGEFFGSGSGVSNTTGNYNTGFGNGALAANTTGQYNTAIGWHTLFANTTGDYNVGIGLQALVANTTGIKNTALGMQTLNANTSGSYNVASGYQALVGNTTGNLNNAYGNDALHSNTTGDQNTAVGDATLNFNSTGSNNTGCGQASLYNQTTGSNNTALGLSAGHDITTGSFNVVIGANANPVSLSGNAQLNLGNLVFGTGLYSGSTPSSTAVSGGKIGIGKNNPATTLDVNGDVTATTFVGALTGNASGSAATLTTARTINGTSFNGSENIIVTAAGSTLSDTVPVAKGGTGVATIGTAGQILQVNAGATAMEFITPSGGGNAQTANPLSQFASTTSAQLLGVISDETGSGALVFGTSPTFVTPVLGVAVATTVNKVTLTAPATGSTLTIADGATLTVSATATISNGTHSNTNTGDNATNTQYSGLVTNANHSGDATGATVLTIAAGVVTLAKMADMATSSLIYRKTASTGAPEVNTLATLKTDLGLTGTNSGDNTVCTSGTATTAATLLTTRAIYGNNFDGSAALTQIIASTFGGTGNGFTKFSGPTTAERTKTLRDAADTILELGGSYTPTGTWTNLQLANVTLGTPATGTLTSCTGLPVSTGISGLGTGVATALGLAITAAASTVLDDTTVSAMVDTLGGASATGTGGLVRGTSPTIATPVINGLPTGTGVATANTASTLVARDASGNFTAGTITAALTGTASGNMPLAGGTFTSGVKHTLGTYTPTGTTQIIDLNAGNITKLSLASASGNVTLTLTVPTSGTMQGTILVLNGSTARNLIIDASDLSTIKFLCAKIDTSTDTASTRRAYTWMWDGTNLNVLQSEMSTT